MDAQKLEAVAALVDEIDADGPPTPEQQEQQAAVDAAELQAREWGMVAFTIGGALAMLAPELRQVYTEEACNAWGCAVVPVAEKYGWSGPGNVPEIGLLLATAGLAVPSYIAISRRLAMLKEAQRKAEAAERARKAAQGAQDVDSRPVGGGVDDGSGS
jgi:hypothetical protein